MIVDSNLFLDLFSDNTKATEFFKKNDHLKTSVIVVMELIQGVKKKPRISYVEKRLGEICTDVYQINEVISQNAYDILKNNFHKQNIGIADAFIASTAIYFDEEVATLNTKHFKGIRGLKVVKPY